ncbi:MAG TPA: protein kinase, partial [Burkholderiaceae bacterium]
IHRDIKPANVLVSADGVAHLLDFGIAALLGEGQGATARGLTPRYAAPEQIAGGAEGVQADIYSLGALLHELLTDALPNAQAASERVPDAARRRALRGELDAILAKALHPDPERRYASADAFAEDIERHLRGECISAFQASAAQRLGKTLRRHWVGVSATVAVLLALAGGGATALVQMRQADAAAQREGVVKAFMAEVFARSSRHVNPGGDGRQALMEDSVQLVETRFAGQPALQAELYGLVGAGYVEMGAYRLAAELFGRQVATLVSLDAPASEQAAARLDQSEALLDDRARDAAGAQLAEAQALLDPDMQALKLRAAVLGARIDVEMGRYDSAEQGLRELDAQLQAGGAEHGRARAWVMSLRAQAQIRKGHFDESLPKVEQAAALAEAADGPDSLTAAAIRLRAAPLYAQAGDIEASDRLFASGIAALRAKGGLQRIRAEVQVVRRWSSLYSSMQRVAFAAARDGTQQSLDFLRAQGDAVPAQMLAQVENALAGMYVDWGDIQDGTPLEASSGPLQLAAARTPEERIVPLGSAGTIAMYQGDHVRAEIALNGRLQARDAAGLRLTLYRANDMRLVALNASMAGWPDKALKVLREGPGEAALRSQGLDPQWYVETLRLARARVLIDRAGPGDAAAALALLDLPRPPRPKQNRTLIAAATAPAGLRGEAWCLIGRSREGLAMLETYLDSLSPDRYEHAPQVARLRAVMGLCALQAGRPSLARALSVQARAAFTAQPGVSAYYKAPLLRLEQALGPAQGSNHPST